MPPTPRPPAQQQHMAPSPAPSSGQPNGLSSYGAHGYNMSLDRSPHSLAPPAPPAPPAYAHDFPPGPVSTAGYARSFGAGAVSHLRGGHQKPQIYTAVYSGISVYEMEVGPVAVMRRRGDGWLNATQILKVAGVDKGKRTKVLEKEILTGEYEKVQGGYGKYQGTWISYRRGREFCRQYGVEDILRPLLDYDVSADGSQGHGHHDTPTKEQAMAAQRKKFYTTAGLEQRPNGIPASHGTFFSNISPTTSVALAAMNKAASFNSPAPRTAGTPRPSHMRRPSTQDVPGGSQPSVLSDSDHTPDAGYGTRPNDEPPRKRMRPDSSTGGMESLSIPPTDASMHCETPTEPNPSFLYDNALMEDSVNAHGDPIALQPLPSPTDQKQQEKMNLILALFADQGRIDYASHRVLTDLSNEDLNMPLDASANNALHWAATLAKVPLLKLLIRKGASIWRGNAAGQSPLISAVLVNNCWEQSCFPELLEVLGPLIDVRDAQGRTVLHHIAVSSGIKGRAPSSKYYLEALLEFLVRMGTKPEAAHASQAASSAAAATVAQATAQANGDGSGQDTERGAPRGPISLVRFLSQIVNARDKAGNTALNLVARIGNRSIIQQLLEIHADPSMPNHRGVCAKDFGVGLEPGDEHRVQPNGSLAGSQRAFLPSAPLPVATPDGESGALTASQAEDVGHDLIQSMTSLLTQNLASHKELLAKKSETIDRLNEQIRELSSLQKSDLAKLQEMKERLRVRAERRAQVANLRREIEKKKAASQASQKRTSPCAASPIDLEPDWFVELQDGISPTMGAHERLLAASSLPAAHALNARVNAYRHRNHQLESQAAQLRAQSIELESLYRKVVALCTGVPEDKVEESLPALVAAVESERGRLGETEVGRVRDFLRRVDAGKSWPERAGAPPAHAPAYHVADPMAHDRLRLTAQKATAAAAAAAAPPRTTE